MASRPKDLSLGGSFVQLAIIAGTFLGGMVVSRFFNDMFTEHIAKKQWYPYHRGYLAVENLARKVSVNGGQNG